MLLRHLIATSQSWCQSIVYCATKSLENISSLIDTQSHTLKSIYYQYPASVYPAITSLILIGGCVEGLRVGGRIEVKYFIFDDHIMRLICIVT